MKTGHGDQKYGFMQLNYEDALDFVADTFNLSVKSVEKIVSKQVGDVALLESMTGNEDFARLLTESERRKSKILRDLDEEKTP